jgi:hypothetical protein
MFAVRFASMHVDSMFLYTVNPGSKSPYALCLLNHCSIIVILKKTGVEFGITGSRIWFLYLFRWLLQMRTYFCLGGLPPWILSNKIKTTVDTAQDPSNGSVYVGLQTLLGGEEAAERRSRFYQAGIRSPSMKLLGISQVTSSSCGMIYSAHFWKTQHSCMVDDILGLPH